MCWVFNLKGLFQGVKPKQVEILQTRAPPIPANPLTLWEQVGPNNCFIRVGGLCGATALMMSVYGRSKLTTITNARDYAEAKTVFETANRLHMIHSVVLLLVPLANRPKVVRFCIH